MTEALLRERIRALEAALRTIAERKGPYSRDPLTHASNTIDAMASTAVDALKETTVTAL